MNGKRNSGMIRFGRAETAAAAVFLLLAALLFFCSGYAPVGEDECFYYATATGLLRGGRMFTDEWHLSQTSCLFQLLPLWLFRTATGGTEGLVLFMRRAFIAADLCIFIFLFAKLKKYSAVTAVLGSALLCADLFAGIFALNYYNMTLRFAVLAGVLLLPRDGETLPSARSAALAGVMTAFAVLSQPSMLLAYALYSVFVLIRTLAKKKNRALFGNYDFALNGKSWLLLSAAAACCAAALLAVVIIRSGARTLLENLPELLKNSEYVMTATGNIMNRMKPAMLIDAIGGLNAAALAVLPAIAGICKKAGAGKWVKLALTIAVQGFAVAAIVHGFDDMLNCVTYPITMYALTVYILCDRKDRRIFSLWILSAMCGFAVDYTSTATLFYGGRIAYIPAVYFTVRLIEELRQTGGRKKLPARLPAAVSLLLACALLLCVVVCAAAPAGVGVLSAGEPENGYSLLTSGPLRGIRASGAFV